MGQENLWINFRLVQVFYTWDISAGETKELAGREPKGGAGLPGSRQGQRPEQGGEGGCKRDTVRSVSLEDSVLSQS